MSGLNFKISGKWDKGFSLIEVMVALILLAGGLLSVAYMQNYSLQFGQESYHRSQIMVSANELIESMRAKQISSDDASADVTDYTTAVSLSEATIGCDPAQSNPRNDVICYAREVSRSLPYGTAQVAVNAVDNSFFDISVFWSDRGLSEQADYSDSTVAESSVNLNSATDCNNAENRFWFNGTNLTWPFGGQPGANLCLVVHTWSVKILNTSTL